MNKNFPTYSNSRRTGDQGVTLVKSIIENEFSWIFRPTHLEDDFGIDGYLDIIGRDDSVTGKYIAVQIKTGQSYFKVKKSFGWLYTGENKHLNYYLNSKHPLIIILVNLELNKAFWVEFDINKINKSNSGWSIIVPETNEVSIHSKTYFEKIAGDVIDYMPQIEYQWEINEAIKNTGLTYLLVSKKEIQHKDISGFIKLLEKLTIDDEMINKSRGKISFLIDGYNNDEEELYEIQEVRDWIKILVPEFKYWGYFLNMEDWILKYTGMAIIHFCYVDIKIINRDKLTNKNQIEPDPEQTISLLQLLFLWLNEFCNKYQISETIIREQSDLIIKSLFGNTLDELRNKE